MKCAIWIDDKFIQKHFGKISKKDFERFCKDAVVSKIFELQFMGNQKESKD